MPRQCCLFLSAIAVVVAGCGLTFPELPVTDYSKDRIVDWDAELGDVPSTAAGDWKESRIITHALGRIDQYAYTNSKEAFVTNYKRGARVFEVDLLLTDDGRLVCAHDWNSFSKMVGGDNVARTFEEFMQTKIYGRYTPLSFRDLALMLKRCPDVFLVTDTKDYRSIRVRRAFAALVADATSVDDTILERIIPQLYDPAMLETIEKIHPFKEYLFTRYRRGTWEYRIIGLIEKRPEIKCVAFPTRKISSSFCERLKAKHVRSYTHTVNSIDDVKRYAAWGIDGFYSDDLTNEDVKNTGIR